MVAFHLPEARSDAVQDYVAALHEELLVSEFGAGEVASAIARHVRMDIFTRDQAEFAFLTFDEWRRAATYDVEMDAADMKVAHQLVRTLHLGLRMPDALHIAIAMRRTATLVTLDENMARAAAALDVTIAMPK